MYLLKCLKFKTKKDLALNLWTVFDWFLESLITLPFSWTVPEKKEIEEDNSIDHSLSASQRFKRVS